MHQTYVQAKRILESNLAAHQCQCSLDQLDGTLTVQLRVDRLELKIGGIARPKWTGTLAAHHLAEELQQYLEGLDDSSEAHRPAA